MSEDKQPDWLVELAKNTEVLRRQIDQGGKTPAAAGRAAWPSRRAVMIEIIGCSLGPIVSDQVIYEIRAIGS
jgi:hypothetical protein